jgi:hypothetical protein
MYPPHSHRGIPPQDGRRRDPVHRQTSPLRLPNNTSSRSTTRCQSRSGVRATLWRVVYDLYRLLRLTTSSRRCAATQTDQPISRPLLPMTRSSRVLRITYIHQWPRQLRLDTRTHLQTPFDNLHCSPKRILSQVAQVVRLVELSRSSKRSLSLILPPQTPPLSFSRAQCPTPISKLTSKISRRRKSPETPRGTDILRTIHRFGTKSQQEHLVPADSCWENFRSTVGRSVCKYQLYIPMHIHFF